MPATVAGAIRDGVPPPKKMDETRRPGASRPMAAISLRNAATNRTSSMPPWRTWLLKSQYGHLARQKGQ
jgi:hypothetical protein